VISLVSVICPAVCARVCFVSCEGFCINKRKSQTFSPLRFRVPNCRMRLLDERERERERPDANFAGVSSFSSSPSSS